MVAVLDSGIDYDHEDLENMVYTFSNGSHGYDFADDDNDTMDSDYHGTMVSGVLAAQMNNDLGIAGTAQITILPVKVLSSTEEEWSFITIAMGIRYAADQGADIISISLGYYNLSEVPSVHTDMVNDSIEYAWSKGCIIVAASGDDYLEPICFPARHPLVIAVGGTDEAGIQDGGDRIGEKLMYDSTYLRTQGGEISCVAPSENVITTYKNETDPSWLYYDNGTGTSLAVPHVSGGLALMLSYRPSLTNDEAWSVLNATCFDMMDPDADDAPFYSDDPG